jgi:hypothetical protein
MQYEFVCVWCGKKSSDPYSVCNAPDGDGHLFVRKEVKESTKTAHNFRRAKCRRKRGQSPMRTKTTEGDEL